MAIILGLDLGSNSVGSAWVDTEKQEIVAGVSIFPAGVDETDTGRGTPKNQERREKRSLRRTLARRSQRKRKLRQILTEFGLLPANPEELERLIDQNPWHLRRRGLDQPLTAYEFGRVLVHLNQRRGAFGLKLPDPGDTDTAANEDAKVKGAIEHTRQVMKDRTARTFGEMMAGLLDERAVQFKAIRNRGQDNFEFHADRTLIRDEFLELWKSQKKPGGALSSLSDKQQESLKSKLDKSERDKTWRHSGAIFGQRNTYWDVGTLGRCDLEPTDRCVPIADRHASYYRVVESVNNIRIEKRGEPQRALTAEERSNVIDVLRRQKTGKVATIRKALGINTKELKAFYSLNIENDPNREINTDWFYREIVHGAIGEESWNQWPENKKEGLNRAILKCDPAIYDDAKRLGQIAKRIGLDETQSEKVVDGWLTRPKLEERLNLSRRAVCNLLPYMEAQDAKGRWPTQIEARGLFAADGENDATTEQRERYTIGAQTLSKADRHYMDKHQDELPPAPMLSNPVVRKAIHEVRRHVIAHIKAHNGQKPDRIAIEFARETKRSKKVSDEILYRNRNREKIRKDIIENVIKPAFGNGYHSLSANQEKRAIERVLLARQQKSVCAYSGETITEMQAANGNGLEIDHIIPYSRCGNNSWSNRVLCWQKSNRDKGNLTPREWWKESFDKMARPMEKILKEDGSSKGDYFTQRDYIQKWQNFSAEEVPLEWKGSQLSDTAYAAREVQNYLKALWRDKKSHLEGGKRRIFVTKGAYTHLVRKEWQLFKTRIDTSDATRKELKERAAKNRGDHREHAMDAVAIALSCAPAAVTKGPEKRPSTRIDDIVHLKSELEKKRHQAKREGRDPSGIKSESLAPPWGDSVDEFRRQVISLIYGDEQIPGLIISHRPVGRKITGSFHKEKQYGVLKDRENAYTIRKHVTELDPKNIPLEIVKKKGRPSDVVHDPDLRKRLRKCIKSYEYIEKDNDDNIKTRYFLDPDNFKTKEIKQAFKAGAICQESGVPIRRVKLLRTMTDPVIIKRKKWDFQKEEWVRDTGGEENVGQDELSRADRVYEGRNNHHIEIRKDERGKWSGVVVPMFEAARRTHLSKHQPVDRSNQSGQFIMSLAEGETVYLKHKKTGEPGFYVVFKLSKSPAAIFLKHHWDARRDKGEKNDDGTLIEGSKREKMRVSPAQLCKLAPPGYEHPIKVRVSPVGEVTELHGD